MDAKTLIANFETLAEAPGGVDRLRELVLRLAVMGKLVEQHAADEAGPILLRRIARFRQDSGAKKLEPAANTVKPPLPSGWVWTHLDQLLVLLRNGISKKPNEEAGLPILRISAVRPNVVNLEELRFLDAPAEEYTSYTLEVNDLLFTRFSGNADYVGVAGVVPQHAGPIVHPDKLIRGVVADGVLPHFVALAVNTGTSRAYIASCARTTVGNLGISGKLLKAAPVPLPPLAEQHRIVAKVDELMALCDDLEQKQNKRHTVRRAARASSLDALTTAQTPDDLARAWTRVKDNWTDLTSQPDDVPPLRQAMRALGVVGALTKQDHGTTGGALLQLIAKRRSTWITKQHGQLRKEGEGMQRKLAKQKARPPEQALPANWCWATLLDICLLVVDCHNKTAPYVSTGVPIIRTSNVRHGLMDVAGAKRISQSTYDYWARRCPPAPGDIIFTREAPMGEAAIVPPGPPVCLGQRTMLLRVDSDTMDVGYLLHALLEPGFQARMRRNAVGMTVEHLRVGDVENLFIPVPPRSEQLRIASLLDRMMAQGVELEMQAGHRQRAANQFAAAAVSAIAVAPELEG